MSRATLLAVLAALPTLAPAQAPPPGVGTAGAGRADVAALIARSDAAYPRRDEPGVLDEVRRPLEEAERLAPGDYDVLWRLARLEFWLADDPTVKDEEKSRLGKRAWEYGDRAIAAGPDRVEGYQYAAAGMGNYGLGIGVLKALRLGIEGKVRETCRVTRPGGTVAAATWDSRGGSSPIESSLIRQPCWTGAAGTPSSGVHAADEPPRGSGHGRGARRIEGCHAGHADDPHGL